MGDFSLLFSGSLPPWARGSGCIPHTRVEGTLRGSGGPSSLSRSKVYARSQNKGKKIEERIDFTFDGGKL